MASFDAPSASNRPEAVLPPRMEWDANSSISVRILAGLTSALLCLALYELFTQTGELRVRLLEFLVVGGAALVLAFRAVMTTVGSVAIIGDRVVVKPALLPGDTMLLKDITTVALGRGAKGGAALNLYSKGRPIVVDAVSYDIAEMREMQQAIVESCKRIGNFVSTEENPTR